MQDNLNQTLPVNPQETSPVAEVSQTPPTSSIPQSPPLQAVTPDPSKNSKIKMIAVLIIILAVLGAMSVFGYSYFKGSKLNNQEAIDSNIPSKNANSAKQEVINSTATDTSDAQIDKDLQSIDTGLSDIDTSTTAVDQGLNDQQTNLQ